MCMGLLRGLNLNLLCFVLSLYSFTVRIAEALWPLNIVVSFCCTSLGRRLRLFMLLWILC